MHPSLASSALWLTGFMNAYCRWLDQPYKIPDYLSIPSGRACVYNAVKITHIHMCENIFVVNMVFASHIPQSLHSTVLSHY